MQTRHLLAPMFALALLSACEGCDEPRLGEVPVPRDAGPGSWDGGRTDEDAGPGDAGREDAGVPDGGIPDAGRPDAGIDPCEQLAGDLPAPVWRDVYPFSQDGAIAGGLTRDAYWTVDETHATLAVGFSGRLTRPELSPEEQYVLPTTLLLHTLELASGETGSMGTLRSLFVGTLGQARPRGAFAVPVAALAGDAHLPNDVFLPTAAPLFFPFALPVRADGTLVEPLWRMGLDAPEPPELDASGVASLALRPDGRQVSVFGYRGTNARIDQLDAMGNVISTRPMPDVLSMTPAIYLGLHDATGALVELRALEGATDIAAPLALDDRTLLFLETESGTFTMGEQTIAIPEGATQAIVALDAAHELVWVRPVAGPGRLEDLIEVGEDRFCANVIDDAAFLRAPGAWSELPNGVGLPVGHVACFDRDGWLVGAARVDLGSSQPTGLVKHREITLDRLAGGVGLSAGFLGELHVDDGRGGVVELSAAGGPEDLDGVLLRFDGDARLVEARHLATPYDTYLRAMAEVGDDLLVVGAFRECLPLRTEDGGVEVIRQAHPEIEGFDGFIARFPDLLRPAP